MPVRRRGGRAVVAAAALLTLVAVAVLADPFGGSSAPSGPSKEVRALRSLVPEEIRGSCTTATSIPPHAVAGLECHPDETYTISYARFRSPNEMQTAFEAYP